MGLFHFFKSYKSLILKQSFDLSFNSNIYLDEISLLPSGRFIALTNDNCVYYLDKNFNLIQKINIINNNYIPSYISIKHLDDIFCIYNEKIIKIYSLLNSCIKYLTSIFNFKNIEKVEFFQSDKLIVYNDSKFYILQNISKNLYQIKLVLFHDNLYHSIFMNKKFHQLLCIANYKSIILFNYKHLKFQKYNIIPLKDINQFDIPYKIFNINKNKIIVIFKPGPIGHYEYPGDFQFKHISLPDGKIINESKIMFNCGECHYFKKKDIILIIDIFSISTYDLNLNYINRINTINRNIYFYIFPLNDNEIGIYNKEEKNVDIYGF